MSKTLLLLATANIIANPEMLDGFSQLTVSSIRRSFEQTHDFKTSFKDATKSGFCVNADAKNPIYYSMKFDAFFVNLNYSSKSILKILKQIAQIRFSHNLADRDCKIFFAFNEPESFFTESAKSKYLYLVKLNDKLEYISKHDCDKKCSETLYDQHITHTLWNLNQLYHDQIGDVLSILKTGLKQSIAKTITIYRNIEH